MAKTSYIVLYIYTAYLYKVALGSLIQTDNRFWKWITTAHFVTGHRPWDLHIIITDKSGQKTLWTFSNQECALDVKGYSNTCSPTTVKKGTYA